MIIELSERSKRIFRQIVDTYVETGEPIGSRTIARRPDQRLSPASIRNDSPALGQHTDEVLGGILGLNANELNTLLAEGAIK